MFPGNVVFMQHRVYTDSVVVGYGVLTYTIFRTGGRGQVARPLRQAQFFAPKRPPQNGHTQTKNNPLTAKFANTL